jgi:DNA invertase Pin-like site-specific DNA recombinase
MDIYSTVNYMKTNHKTIFDLNIKVTYYVRVSTLKEEQDSSVEHQIEHFDKMISEHTNWTYVQGYVDRVRGESTTNRKAFLQMIEDGKNGKFDLILTKEVSRFARNTIDSLTYTRELLRNGVGVFFQNDNICTVDSDAEFRLTIMASIAQDEVRKMSERIKFGHKQAIKNGTVMGNSRIYGYEKLNGKLIINKHEAEMVRFIFEQYASGIHAIRAIQRQLFDKGYKSRSGSQISHTTICGIITNPKYKGYYCGNKVKIADYRTKEQVFLPEEEWVMYKDETGNIVPAIVDEDLWNRANQIYRQRSEEVKNQCKGNKTTSVLSGKIFCTHCNAPFWRTSYSHRLHKGNNIYQYICREKKTQGANTCPTFAIYENEMYDMLSKCFIDNLKYIGDYTDSFIEICKKVLQDNSSQESIDKLIIEQNTLEHKKEMLLDLYMNGDINKDDFKKRNEKLTTELDNVKNKYKSLTDNQISYKDIERRISDIRKIINDMLNGNEQLSNEEINNLIGMFLERIEVTAIEDKTLDINFIMNFGESKCQFKRSSGFIFQKMIPEQRLKIVRVLGRERIEYTYIINISAIINMGTT